jgi:hypothetical protein
MFSSSSADEIDGALETDEKSVDEEIRVSFIRL